jgi:hypothetical protein
MGKLIIVAKIKKTDQVVQHNVSFDDKIRKMDNEALYDLIYDFLELRHGDVFKWFRFYTI